MFYNETNNFDEIKTLFPDKTEIEVVIRPCLPRADHRVPGGLILRKLMVCFPIIRFFQFWPNCRRLSAGAMSSLQPGGEKRQTRDHCLGLYWVPIHISASLFPVFCLNARGKFAAKLKYGDHQSSSSWKWFCVTLLATFTSAYALGFINSRQGSLFWLPRVPIGSLFHKKWVPIFKLGGPYKL